MKKLLHKIVDCLFYNFMVEVIEENLRVDLILIDAEQDFKHETSMFYVPGFGSFIQVKTGTFEVKKVVHASFGSVAYLYGELRPS